MKRSKKNTEVQWDVDQLNQALDNIIFTQPEWSSREWADKSGLSDSTCRRLLYRETLRPQFRSVDRMAYAAFGMGLARLVLLIPISRKAA